MSERIIIENFGGINKLDLELNKINLLIGPQASGKSITAKLLYYCKSIFNEVMNAAENKITKVELNKNLALKFEDYFPINTWQNNEFKIQYTQNNFQISISKATRGKLIISYSDYLIKELGQYRRAYQHLTGNNDNSFNFNRYYNRKYDIRNKFERKLSQTTGTLSIYNQYFIPAGRSFFANLQSSIFSFLSSNKAIDPFLIEFGSFYENIKNQVERNFLRPKKVEHINVDLLVNDLLKGNYIHEKGKDFLIHADKRKVNLAYASSGQQETLPLALILKAMMLWASKGATLYIEEPEAHLFPTAQKSMVELIATVFNTPGSSLQFFITTHSPYILSSFNNLLYAGELYNSKPEKRSELEKIVSSDKLLNSNLTNAYSLENGKLTSIKCKESNLISQTILDSVSSDIAIQFDKLLDIES